eukprot:jgi/Pico_ML_1/52736/g3400.t2
MWGAGIVNIGAQETWEESKEAAEEHINTLYAYDTTGVVFKPTKASDVPFRNTFDSALSYFVGQNDEYPEDGGFALEPWTDVAFDNKGIVLLDDAAIAGVSEIDRKPWIGAESDRNRDNSTTLRHRSMVKDEYMKCLKENKQDSEKCKGVAKKYLECRMSK